MKPKVKMFLSFVVGAVCGFLVTCALISVSQHVLSDEEFGDYQRIRNRDNLIVAYQEYYKDSIELLSFITKQYFGGNISEYIDSSALTILKNDIGLVEAMEQDNQTKTPSRYSISFDKK